MFGRKRAREVAALQAELDKGAAEEEARQRSEEAETARILDELEAEMRWQKPSTVPIAERLKLWNEHSRGVQPMPSITRVRVAKSGEKGERND